MRRSGLRGEIFESIATKDCSLKWYAIADSAQDRSLPSAIIMPGFNARCLLGGSEGSPVAKFAPHLVELCSPLDAGPGWKWISGKAPLRPCVSVIATHESFDALFQHLAEWTEVMLPDGEQMWLAFWDPAILGTLLGQSDDVTLHVKGPVLSSPQSSALMRNVSGWWYWDRIGQLHSIAQAASDEKKKNGLLLLTQHQVDDLVEASVPDHLLYYLELNQHSLIEDIVPSERYQFVRNGLGRARSLGLSGMRDMVNYLCIELIYKHRMFENEYIRDLFVRVKTKEISFQDALDQLP